MKLLAATTLLIASLGAGSVEAGSIAGAGAGAAISVHWNDHDGHRRGGHGYRRGHREHDRRDYRGHHYANPALWQRYGRRHHARAVNGYAELSSRRPCEWVRVEHLDAYGDPMAVEYKRCFTASGYGFEVPGSRVVIR